VTCVGACTTVQVHVLERLGSPCEHIGHARRSRKRPRKARPAPGGAGFAFASCMNQDAIEAHMHCPKKRYPRSTPAPMSELAALPRSIGLLPTKTHPRSAAGLLSYEVIQFFFTKH
jgi:hypothetical protein